MRFTGPVGGTLDIELISHVPHTVSTWRDVGAAMDGVPALRAAKIGAQDPCRTPVTDLSEQLAGWASDREGQRNIVVALDRGKQKPGGFGWMTAVPGWPRLTLELGYEADWFESADRLDLVVDLFRRLVEASSASYGSVETSNREGARWRQFRDEVAADRQPSPDLRAGEDRFESYVTDVRWLQYFGPAFVARWGIERLEQAGVRHVRVGRGVLVWATTDPWEYDTSAGVTDYAWKRSFYEVLGADTFWHPGMRMGDPGEFVPTHAEHIEAAG